MTHRELSDSCRRQPGIPASECKGELHPWLYATDTAQSLDGMGVDSVVAADFYVCLGCGNRVCVRHAADGWRVSNDWRKV